MQVIESVDVPPQDAAEDASNVPSLMKPAVHTAFNLWIAIFPFVGLVVAIVLLWNDLVTPVDLGILGVLYCLQAFGITMGYHRLLAHRSFETYRPIKYTLAVLGSMAGQGPPIIWVADHRKHHTFADTEGDPHSPHLDGDGWRGALKGLWHAHMGWLFRIYPASDPLRYARDHVRDRGMWIISKLFLPIVAVGLLIPFLAGLAITGTLKGGLTALVWGGFVRLFFGYHTTFAVNSVGHFFGSRRFRTPDESRNVLWLAIPSFGDSFHHNHHAFPTSARHGLRWWELDISGLAIQGLAKLGLAWNVVTVEPNAQARKTINPNHVREAGP